VRDALPNGDAGYILPITDAGRRLATELGRILGDRLQGLHSSPLVRCLQTAEALRAAAGANLTVIPDRHLGDPGVFVVDGARAQPIWDSLGLENVVAHFVTSNEALPGMALPEPAARFLVHHMLAAAADVPGVHVFVTHDSLVTATAARLLERPLGTDAWPWYLEGAFFWRDQNGLHAAYRQHHQAGLAEPLERLRKEDVIEFARREVARTVGLDSGARFFLAGGAFKTLLTGRPARDLDLWAPSDEDRRLLIQALTVRGTARRPDGPFATSFDCSDRFVEVPHNVEPDTLEARLARFDLALSAIGVEHLPGDRWRAVVHPLALESVQRREILLLKPLVNWKYALATLGRMHRYAAELGFSIPDSEVAAIWELYDAQSREIQAGMIERFDRTGAGSDGVLGEAMRRMSRTEPREASEA
jgi:broad specificity phosphatase PhoE